MSTLALITPPGTQPRSPKQPLRVIGIDLGTTNSTVAEILWHPGDADAPRVHCLEVEQPTRQGPFTGTLVPSVVALHEGQVWVGEGVVPAEPAPDLIRGCRDPVPGWQTLSQY